LIGAHVSSALRLRFYHSQAGKCDENLRSNAERHLAKASGLSMRSLLGALIAIWLCATIATTVTDPRTRADGEPMAKIAAPAAKGVAVLRTSKALLTHVRRNRCHARLKKKGNINAGANDVGHCAHERMRACAHTHHIQPVRARTRTLYDGSLTHLRDRCQVFRRKCCRE
jgi:hypothetical protein